MCRLLCLADNKFGHLVENPRKLTPCYRFKLIPVRQRKLTPFGHCKLTPEVD